MEWYALGLALLLLVVVMAMLLRRKLREKYAVLWLLIGVLVLVLALFPQLLGTLTDALGVQVPSNLLFALAIVLLLAVGLHLSWELSMAEEEIRRVAEEAALSRADAIRLQQRIVALERQVFGASPSTDAEPDPLSS